MNNLTTVRKEGNADVITRCKILKKGKDVVNLTKVTCFRGTGSAIIYINQVRETHETTELC